MISFLLLFIVLEAGVHAQTIETIAGGGWGDGLPATEAMLDAPSSIAIDRNGDIYIAETGQRIRRIASDGTIETHWPSADRSSEEEIQIIVDRLGGLYVNRPSANLVERFDPSSGISTPVYHGHIRSLTPAFEGGFYAIEGPDDRVIRMTPGGMRESAPWAEGLKPIRDVATDGEALYLLQTGGQVWRWAHADLTAIGMAPESATALVAVSGRLFLLERAERRLHRFEVGTWKSETYDLPMEITDLQVDLEGRLYLIATERGRLFTWDASVGFQNIAGGGVGDGGSSTDARFSNPFGIWGDKSGRLYVADTSNNRIRVIENDYVGTIAGTGRYGYSGDAGPATAATLSAPTAVVGAQDGRLYISDTFSHRVRIVSPAGWIWTVAGTGQAGWGGDGGPATRATLHMPTGMCIGPDGSLYIADQGSHVVRRIRPDATIETVAGIGRSGFSGDDGPATEAQLSHPAALAFLSDGTLLIADQGNHRIRAVGSDDRIRTFAGTGTAGYGGDGGLASSALLNRPTGVATDPWGRVFISDRLNHALRLVTSTGIISTVGVSSGEAFDPHALFVDGSGAVLVTDTRGQVIRRLAPAKSSVQLTLDRPRIHADGLSVARLIATASDNAPIAWSIIGGVGELVEVASPHGGFEAELMTDRPGQVVVRAMSPGSWGTTVSVRANPTRALSVIDASSTFLANGANEGWVTFGLRELVDVPSGISEGQMSFTVERGDADLRQSNVQVVDGLASVRFVTRRPGNIVIAALAQGAVSLSSRVRASEPSPWQWPDAYEPDTADSGVLLEGKALDRTLHSRDDTDWFRLPVAPGHYYTVETESEEDAQIEVRLGVGQVLARGDGRVRVGPEFDSGLATIGVAADGDMPYRLIWRIDRAATLSASSPSTDLILDGHSSIPLSVSVLNHLGLVDGADDTSRVSVEVLSGDAQIVPPETVISAGRASFQIRPEAIGTVRLSISIPGVEPVLYSWDVEAGVSLDLGTGAGDDGVRTRHVLRDESVPVEIHYSGGVVDLRGIEIHLDIGSLEFERFDAGPAIEGAEMLIARQGNHLILTSAVLGGTLPTEGGLVGRVHLRFTSDTAEVPVSVVSASKGDPAGIRSLGIGDAAQVRLQTDPDPPTWRGMQEQFGRNRGEDGFNGRYDLNGDGTIGFQDFIQFAETQ